MSEDLKRKFWKECSPSRHVGPFMDEGDCIGCSFEHVLEFGDSVGVVEDHVRGFNDEKWPEVIVRWESGLRYGYLPEDLTIVRGR